MTPLAAKLTKMIIDINSAPAYWKTNAAHLRAALYDIHCFELTGALTFLPELASLIQAAGEERFDGMLEKYGFLPAPNTWIEWLNPNLGYRVALLLTEHKNRATVEFFTSDFATFLGWVSTDAGNFERVKGPYIVPTALIENVKRFGGNDTDVVDGLLAISHSFLLLINSPQVIGRRQHMPHRALEKKLIKSLGVGRFPLRAWTEILLRVTKPLEIDDGEPHEAHLTGRRALHFVRKHVRIRRGRLEYVKSHWRGDPALGIKRSRYKVGA